ncbi:MAG: MFS transporter [Aestuariivirga sp.]
MKITPRLAVTLTFVAFGVIVGSQVGTIPVIKAQTGADAWIFGIIAALGTVGTIFSMSLGGWVNRHFDHRAVLLFIMPLAYVTFVSGLIVQSVFTFGLSFVALSLCTGTMDLFMNAEASVVEHNLKRPVFSSFHAAVLYAIGGAAFASGYVADHFGVMWSALPSIPFVALAMFVVHRAIPYCTAKQTENNKSVAALPTKILVLIGIILGLGVAAELTCVQWSGQLLNDMRPDLAAYSGLGVGFYGLCNGTMRLFGDRLRAKYGDIPLVAVSFSVGLCGLIVLSLHPNFEVSVAAFAVTGFGLGLVFPCMFSVAAHLVPEARAAALGLASMVSGPPRILLPLLLGWLAQTQGLSTIYIAAAAGIAVSLIFTYWAAVEMTKQKGAQVALRPNATN